MSSFSLEDSIYSEGLCSQVSKSMCRINEGNTRHPLQTQFAELQMSVCTKVQVDNCNSLGSYCTKSDFWTFCTQRPPKFELAASSSISIWPKSNQVSVPSFKLIALIAWKPNLTFGTPVTSKIKVTGTKSIGILRGLWGSYTGFTQQAMLNCSNTGLIEYHSVSTGYCMNFIMPLLGQQW